MKSNDVALWYLRLNGFLTVQNFVLHPEKKPWSAKTDADVVGVRFPYRNEFKDVADADRFVRHDKKVPYFVIAESTTGRCKVNGPWERADSFIHVLRSFGVIGESRTPSIAESWVTKGAYSGDEIECVSLLLGKEDNQELRIKYPEMEQVTWQEVFQFFYKRFSTYEKQKSDVEVWKGTLGWELWQDYLSSIDESAFLMQTTRRLE